MTGARVVPILRAAWTWSDAHRAECLFGHDGAFALVGATERGWFWYFSSPRLPVAFTEAAVSIEQAKSRAETAMLALRRGAA